MTCRLTLGMRADRDRPPGVMNKLHRKEVDPVIPPRAFPPIQKLVDILGEQGHENDLLPALLALEDVSQVLADVLRVVHNPAYTACYMSKESRAVYSMLRIHAACCIQHAAYTACYMSKESRAQLLRKSSPAPSDVPHTICLPPHPPPTPPPPLPPLIRTARRLNHEQRLGKTQSEVLVLPVGRFGPDMSLLNPKP
jgi:hypothetical protein